MAVALPLAVLASLNQASEPLIWATIGAFLIGAVLELTDRQSLAVPVAAVGWGLFGLFWLSMFPYFYTEVQSPLESILSLAGVPLSLYAGYLLVTGRKSLLLLSRTVAVMGLIYLPFTLIEPLKAFLIETVAVQSHWGMQLFGYSPGLELAPNGYTSRFAFEGYTTYIVLSCTGIGSISIFAGLVAAVRAPLKRKLIGIAAATGIIWILNLARNVFVGLAAPLGWFDYPVFETITNTLAGDGMQTSFFIAHHVISQSLSVIALLGITLLVVRLVPQTLAPLEEVLYLLTGNEYDLRDAFGQPVRTDGGDT